ncbi:hypothetical protein LOK49_LG12G01277 [Camellia lanceoleosa]|uniref:Uncharacterized protein n=1 Tax=Camellia lanceoleosa TaxID=1840588 RepID=A0ACC0FRP0_9ERIC|nr:hypothetical protein LOK49_LG12G01277 [Camellia lanceoleosa]
MLLRHSIWASALREVIFEDYKLEYGTDCLEMHLGAVQPGKRVLVIDDLVATGRTLSAAIRLLECVGAVVVECACVIGLPELKVMLYKLYVISPCLLHHQT